MMRRTLRPAILPASFVASRCALLKYAGTVMTASVIVSPRYASASARSFWRIIALISGGAYSLPPALTRTSPFGPSTTSYGTIFISSETAQNFRPMNRLIEKIVLCGFVTCWRFAGAPTSRWPSFVNATTEGVVRPPSAFGMTVGSPPSITATQELVVPRSMPIVFAMRKLLVSRFWLRKSQSDGSRLGRLGTDDEAAQCPSCSRLCEHDRAEDRRAAAPAEPAEAIAGEGEAEERRPDRLQRERQRGARRARSPLRPGLYEEAERAREHARDEQRPPDGPAARCLEVRTRGGDRAEGGAGGEHLDECERDGVEAPRDALKQDDLERVHRRGGEHERIARGRAGMDPREHRQPGNGESDAEPGGRP